MKPMLILALFAFVLLFMQGVFGIYQYRVITKKYKEVRVRNPLVSVGRSKKFGRGCIALLAFTKDGLLTEGHILKGLTVFARFRALKGMEGKSYLALKESIEQQKPSLEGEAILQALGFVKEGLEKTEADEDLDAVQPC